MNRTKFPDSTTIPDAINCSNIEEFTQIPNSLLRTPTLSFKAKGIICLLLSNKNGWKSHMKVILSMTTDKNDAVSSGIQELEKEGYLLRVKYRDKNTKVWRGSFWAYTNKPNQFNFSKTLQLLKNKGLEPELDLPELDLPGVENPALIILIDKKTKEKTSSVEEEFDEKYITNSMFEEFWKLYPKKIDKGRSLSSWIAICNRKEKRPTWKQIKKAIIYQKKTERWKDSKYIPHPTTWLNQRRWLDDPKEMKLFSINKNQDKPKVIKDPVTEINYYLNEKDGKYYHKNGNEYLWS